MYKQTSWHEPLLFQYSNRVRSGHILPKLDQEIVKLVGDIDTHIQRQMMRKNDLALPNLSEVEVVRHFLRLSQMNYGVDSGIYPLGSCTMKYNPKINELLANLSSINLVHPYQQEDTIQGILEMLYHLENR